MREHIRCSREEGVLRVVPLEAVVASSVADQRAAIEAALADSGLYESGNQEHLAQLLKHKAEVDRGVEDAELEWLRAMDAFETATSDPA